jgi:hypothetical protein
MQTYQSQISSKYINQGTNYIRLKSGGTDLQNAVELTDAYNSAKLSEPGEQNIFTILVPPGMYKFLGVFTLDTDFINIVSLSNKIDVIFNGTFDLDLTANNVHISGINLLDNSFSIVTDLDKILIENCIVGENSFIMIGGSISGTFKNIKTGDHSFRVWGAYGEISGTFNDIKVQYNCFKADIGSLINGTFNNIECGLSCLAPAEPTGFFKNIIGPNIFEDLTTFSGIIHNAIQTDVLKTFGIIDWRGKIYNSVNGDGSLGITYEETPEMPTLVLSIKTSPTTNSSSNVDYFRIDADYTGIDETQDNSIVWSQITSHSVSLIMESTPTSSNSYSTFYDIENNVTFQVQCIITDIYNRTVTKTIDVVVAI